MTYNSVLTNQFSDILADTETTLDSLRYAIILQQKEELILQLESFIDRLNRFKTLEK